MTVTRITWMDMQSSRAMICVNGELDLANVAAFTAEAQAALEGNPSLLVIDLRGCEFIDASVIAALIKLQKGFDGSSSTVLAVVGRGEPQRLLQITATDEVVPMFESTADALHTLDGAERDKTARASSFG